MVVTNKKENLTGGNCEECEGGAKFLPFVVMENMLAYVNMLAVEVQCNPTRETFHMYVLSTSDSFQWKS